MSPEQRLELIRRVLNTAFLETETWGELGTPLAYLCHAIADNGRVDWRDDEVTGDYVARCLFKSWFLPDDLVWQFIQI